MKATARPPDHGPVGHGADPQAAEGSPQNILTHCNTGALATGGFGTALGVIRAAHLEGLVNRIYADETRPWLQGSRLTAWELANEGIPVSLNVDSAAAHLMKTENITWVIVGADRITANGDVANKIGTYQLAVNAMHHGVRFMVVAPSPTIDMNLESGEDIPIEERDGRELLEIGGRRVAAEVDAYNPVFDVTPADLIDAIVTERGVVERPDPAHGRPDEPQAPALNEATRSSPPGPLPWAGAWAVVSSDGYSSAPRRGLESARILDSSR